MTVCRDSRENRNLEQTDKIVASRRETARKVCNRFDKNTHRHNKFGRWLHKYEKLCRLTKRFWDTTECIVEHSQNMANNLVYLFYNECALRDAVISVNEGEQDYENDFSS